MFDQRVQNKKDRVKEVSCSHLLILKLPLLYACLCTEMKWIETTLSCQYITALKQLERQHDVSSVEMDFHLIGLSVLARVSRQMS